MNNITEALLKELPARCGQQAYFHDKDNDEELSGIYTVASYDLQQPATETVLIFRDRQQAWAKPIYLQFALPGKPLRCMERVVLKRVDGTFDHKSVDVTAVMLAITNASHKHTEAVATGKAMELLSQFRYDKHITNEGCVLMTYDYWLSQYHIRQERNDEH